MKVTAALLCLLLANCSGIDFGDRPGRDVSKETGPLTIPPTLARAPR